MKHSRIDCLDMARGLGMLLVVWAHISTWKEAFIFAFHMPLFFFLSGFLYQANRYHGWRDWFGRKLKSLLIPYALYSVATWVLWAGYRQLTAPLSLEEMLAPLGQTLFAQGADGMLVHNVPLWFLTCLFVTELLYVPISKLPEGGNLLACVVLSCVGYLMITVEALAALKQLPWNLECALVALGFYGAGHCLKRHLTLDRMGAAIGDHVGISLLLCCGLGLIVELGARQVGCISLGADRLQGGLLYYVNAFAGLAMMLVLSVLVSPPRGGWPPVQALQSGLLWVGRNSLHVMCLHNPIKGIVIVMLAKLLQVTKATIETSLPYSLLALGLTLVGVCCSVLVIKVGIKWFRRMREG